MSNSNVHFLNKITKLNGILLAFLCFKLHGNSNITLKEEYICFIFNNDRYN